LVSRAVWLALPVAAVLAFAIASRRSLGEALLLASALVAVTLLSTLPFAVRVWVTPRRLVIGRRSFQLEDLEHLRVNRVLSRSARPFVMTLSLRSSTVELRLPAFPVALKQALERTGVRLDVVPWWAARS